MMQRLIKIFDDFALYLTFFLLAVVSLNILTRQLYNVTDGDMNLMISGSIELSKYTLLLIVFMSLPHAVTHSMVQVDFISNKLSNSSRTLLNSLWIFLMSCFTAILTWLFGVKTLLTFSRGDTTQDLLIPLFYFYALISIACFVASLSGLYKIKQNILLGYKP